MFVKPNPGRLVRHPETGRVVPADGANLPDRYARRRLAAGDVSSAKRPSRPKAKATPAAKKED